MNKALLWLTGVIGVGFLVLTLVYWTTPAGSLPSFIPGYEPGVAGIHFKHGLGSLIVALGLFAFVWFKTAPKQNSQS